jgi:hypothetical protein
LYLLKTLYTFPASLNKICLRKWNWGGGDHTKE